MRVSVCRAVYTFRLPRMYVGYAAVACFPFLVPRTFVFSLVFVVPEMGSSLYCLGL